MMATAIFTNFITPLFFLPPPIGRRPGPVVCAWGALADAGGPEAASCLDAPIESLVSAGGLGTRAPDASRCMGVAGGAACTWGTIISLLQVGHSILWPPHNSSHEIGWPQPGQLNFISAIAVCYTTRPRLRQAKTPLSSIFLFLVPIPRTPHSAFRIPHSPFPWTS